jgi:hypothetical protein
VDQRVASVPDRQEDERGGEGSAPADAVDDDADRRPGEQAGGAGRRQHEPGRPQREAAHVVQVDDKEREREAVADRVREPAEAEDPDGPGEPRVEAPEIASHA